MIVILSKEVNVRIAEIDQFHKIAAGTKVNYASRPADLGKFVHEFWAPVIVGKRQYMAHHMTVCDSKLDCPEWL